ncbi:MAG: hypothetical protein UY72_C0028G0017 [Candidatus Uhrbacteria bacterium GW2011_GWD2_52_7]|uniref:Uncharacterized protein n=1 Tax=Candidatus Uhrbacteria bacterium GW2011_GWD2_52_7 TaxID=1618989 RepID=A0A0G2AC21_9BACT|nr:MAG: hypothetical protein UY72_C0028G0017 [Candidatus Uhrbacteria bacterium GW2011_GWD2_52_7]
MERGWTDFALTNEVFEIRGFVELSCFAIPGTLFANYGLLFDATHHFGSRAF